MTSNGVTAALRHAAEAAALILKFRERGELPLRARRAYSSRILQTAKFFNEGIEKIIYEPVVRNRIGLAMAGAVYTSPAWSMNVVYARLSPAGIIFDILFRGNAGIFSDQCLDTLSVLRPDEIICRNEQEWLRLHEQAGIMDSKRQLGED